MRPSPPWWSALPRPQWSKLEPVPQNQAWFEVYRVTEGVFAIYEPRHFEEVISYLILGDRQAVLLDTGMGIGDMKRLAGELTPMDIIVLNSHTHFDHVGGNYQFDTIYAMDTPFSRDRSKGTPPDEARAYVGEGQFWKAPPEDFSPEAYQIRPFTITHVICDGDTMDLGGRTLEILHTPGHAPDEISVMDRTNRLLFTADTFYPAHMYTHFPESDFDTYVETARRLAGLADKVDWLLPAHNYTPVDAEYLKKMYAAFQTIREGGGEYETLDEGIRKYTFDGFYLIVKGKG
mgnify:FL=1